MENVPKTRVRAVKTTSKAQKRNVRLGKRARRKRKRILDNDAEEKMGLTR